MRWGEPIVRSIRYRYTNGMTEGFNNKIKLIQRMAYGKVSANLDVFGGFGRGDILTPSSSRYLLSLRSR
jgi:hypothetical protein